MLKIYLFLRGVLLGDGSNDQVTTQGQVQGQSKQQQQQQQAAKSNDRNEKKKDINDEPQRKNEKNRDLLEIEKIFGRKFDPNGAISKSVYGCMEDGGLEMDDLQGFDEQYLKNVVEKWIIETNGRDIDAIRGKFVSGIKKLNQQSQSNGMQNFIYI